MLEPLQVKIHGIPVYTDSAQPAGTFGLYPHPSKFGQSMIIASSQDVIDKLIERLRIEIERSESEA